MLSSMTGFGRAVAKTPIGDLSVEIQSVNRKFLEVSVSLPKEFSRFEMEVRKQVGAPLSRGAVSVRVFLTNAVETYLPDAKALKKFKESWDQIAREIGTDPSYVDLSFLMRYFPSIQNVDQELPELRSTVDEALRRLLEMKKVEGKALAEDLSNKLVALQDLLKSLEECTPNATEKLRKKLAEKMKEALQTESELNERLLREVALFAEKVDVSEEITRLKSHFSQFQQFLSEGAGGRKMDFLIQEIGREINTIGSKSMEASMTRLVVEMKSELEKMREQVQNLE